MNIVGEKNLNGKNAQSIITQIRSSKSIIKIPEFYTYVGQLDNLPEIFAELRRRASSSKVAEQEKLNELIFGESPRGEDAILRNCR